MRLCVLGALMIHGTSAAIDVVVARHAESLSWMAAEPALHREGTRVIVYQKGDRPTAQADDERTGCVRANLKIRR